MTQRYEFVNAKNGQELADRLNALVETSEIKIIDIYPVKGYDVIVLTKSDDSSSNQDSVDAKAKDFDAIDW